MRPFRNSGWRYLKTFESIIPVSGAKGKHVFAPTLATVSSAEFDDDNGKEVELGSIVKGIGSGGEGSNSVLDHGANIDIDQGGDFVNKMNVKRKYPTIKDDATSLTTDATGLPPSVSSTSLGPARKKTSLTLGLRSKQSSKSRTRISSKLSTGVVALALPAVPKVLRGPFLV